MGIIIVDLPTGFNHEQKNSNANPGYHREHEKKYFHDVAPQVPIYATIDCTDDGENGFRRLRVGFAQRELWRPVRSVCVPDEVRESPN